MATGRIKSNSQLLGQTVTMTAQSGNRTDDISVADYGEPPVVVPPDYFPTAIQIGVGQQVDASIQERRHMTVNLQPLGTADSITVRNLRKLSDGTPRGNVRTRGTHKATITLQSVRGTDVLAFDYTAVKAGVANIEGVAVVTVLPTDIPQGWGIGRFYVLPRAGNGRALATPGRNHRKVHVSASVGLTAVDLAARHSTTTGTITATWLRDTIAIGAGSDGVLKYGETEALALDPIEGLKLWNLISGTGTRTSALVNSNWLLLKRGDTFASTFDPQFGWGESPIHPIVFSTYGSGARPVMGRQIVNNDQARCVLFQDYQVNYSGIQENWLSGDFINIDNIRSSHKIYSQGLNYVIRGLSITNSTALDGAKTTSDSTNDYWQNLGERTSGSFIENCEGLLAEGNFYDHNGWTDGYIVSTLKTYPRPIEQYSHGFYLQYYNRDTTVSGNMITQPAFSAVQMRTGGIISDNFIAGSNSGFFGGQGNALTNGEPCGQFSHYDANISTWGGFKDALWQDDYNNWVTDLSNDNIYKARGINYSVNGSSGTSNVVVNSGAGVAITSVNDIGPIGTGSGDRTVAVNVASGKTAYFDDTLVYAWVDNANANLGSATTADLDDATVEEYAKVWLSNPSATRADFIAGLRALEDPWTQHQSIMDYFRQKTAKYVAPRAVATTLTFAPDELGRTPGWRADNRLDWSTGDLPGTVAGDSINLDGYDVHFGRNPKNTMATLGLSSGAAMFHGGLWSFTSVTADAGARLSLDWSADLRVDGYTGSSKIAADIQGGRLVNTGTWSGACDLNIRGESDVVLAYDSAAYTVPSGSTLTIHGAVPKVGFDGSVAGAASITIAGTLHMRSSCILSVSGILPANGDVNDVMVGAVLTGQTSLAQATVVEIRRINNRAQELVLSDCTGVFLNGEAVHATLRRLKFNELGAGFYANVAAVPVYTLPQISEFRSGLNGATAPSVASTFTCGGGLIIDCTGMLNTAYDLVVADTVSGTFAAPIITNGEGSVSYTGTKVIFTKTA